MKQQVRGLIDNQNVKAFILAGKAIFSVENKLTKNHVTFKVSLKEYTKEQIEQAKESNIHLPQLYFVQYCNQYDSYSYLGLIVDGEFKLTVNSPKEDSLSCKSFVYIYNHYIKSDNHDERLEFYHEGRCAYCGRVMTDPESVKRGFGPTCFKRAHERVA